MLSIPPALLARYDESWRGRRSRSISGRIPGGVCASTWISAPSTSVPRRSGTPCAHLCGSLGRRGQADWMRKQAVDAVRLYFFLDDPGGQRQAATAGSPGVCDMRTASRPAPQPAPRSEPPSPPRGVNGRALNPGEAASPASNARREPMTSGIAEAGSSRPARAPVTAERTGPSFVAAPPPVAEAPSPPTGGAAPDA